MGCGATKPIPPTASKYEEDVKPVLAPTDSAEPAVKAAPEEAAPEASEAPAESAKAPAESAEAPADSPPAEAAAESPAAPEAAEPAAAEPAAAAAEEKAAEPAAEVIEGGEKTDDVAVDDDKKEQ